MSRPIRGTRDLKNRQMQDIVVAGPSVKIACPKCRAPAYPDKGGTGTNSFVCTGCGALFSSSRM